LEAALSGCALVLGDIPSLREIWQDNAVFVTPGDAAAPSSAIRRLIATPARREELAERARRHACQFDRDAMTAAYLDVYSHARKEHLTCVA
jgi:glycosyltransferase involved in cell wall biosynthesis